jgi:WD40 repeat protein
VLALAALSETWRTLQRERQARTLLDEARVREERQVYLDRVTLAGRMWLNNQLEQSGKLLDQCPPAHRRLEWRLLNALRTPYAASLPHGKVVLALAYSPDEKRLATADGHGRIRLWDLATGQILPFTADHGTGVISLAFSPDGKWLATVCPRRVKLWDAATGEQVFDRAGVHWLAFGRDGSLASAVGEEVRIYEVPSGELRRTLRGVVNAVFHGTFSPDGRHLAVGGFAGYHRSPRGEEGTLQIWDVGTGEAVGEPRRYPRLVDSLAYTPDGQRLIVGQHTTTLVTDADTGRMRGQIEEPLRGGIKAWALSRDGRYLAYAAPDCTVRVWDLTDWREAFVLRGHAIEVAALTFRPDGLQLASSDLDGAVKLWDLGRRSDVRPLARFRGLAGGLVFAPGGRLLAVAPQQMRPPPDTTSEVRVFDVLTGQEVRRLPGGTDVAISPDGRWLAAGGREEGVTLWDLRTGQEVRTLGGRKHQCRRLAFSPDSGRLASAGIDGVVHIWDPKTGQEVASWQADVERLDAVAFSPDGGRLATAGKGGGVSLWDCATGHRLDHLEPSASFHAVAFSPVGGRLAACGKDDVIHLWDADTGRLLHLLRGHRSSVADVAFSPDGQRLVSGGEDRAVKLWDVETGQEILSLPGVQSKVGRVAVSPDGSRIAAVDNHILLWEAGPSTKD